MLKSFYKDCEVEVTAVYESENKKQLTPNVEIRCRNAAEPHLLTTKKTFATEREAELSGAQMAREWIDANVEVRIGHKRAGGLLFSGAAIQGAVWETTRMPDDAKALKELIRTGRELAKESKRLIEDHKRIVTQIHKLIEESRKLRSKRSRMKD